MRIISQSGRFDIPYENAVVYLEYESVIAKVGDERYSMGNYSTEEKAVKAMKMLIEKYESRMELDGGYDDVHKCYVQPNFWVLPKVFQLPQDEEVEV